MLKRLGIGSSTLLDKKDFIRGFVNLKVNKKN